MIKKYENIIDKITKSLEKHADEEVLNNASYETGLLGFSLYYLYLSKYKQDLSYIPIAEDYFNKGLSSLNLKDFKRIHGTDSLDSHLAHIGRYLIFCTENNLLNISSEDYLIKLDSILFDLMKSKIGIKDFDLGTGALAAGYYFLSRLKNGSDVKNQISFLVHSIYDNALKDSVGNFYWKSPSLYDRVYLGISHGSSLMISFIISIYEEGIETELCEEIAGRAIGFLAKQYRESEYKGLFPNMIGDKIEPMQFSLCYGDIGVGYALFRAANVLKDKSIESLSTLILDDCLLRAKEDNLTLDAGIFYGASGLAIAFDKLAKISGNNRFAKRAKYWNEQILQYATHSNDYADFKSRLVEDNILWQISYGWGIIGIGMTLMYFDSEILPSFSSLTFIA
ncbi:hypothetical protein HZP84_10425 [Elizabethkingia anophelis]|uniref:Lantibiotic modifying enzyme n=2 Tax=Elizabethkingia TaxID=308865 RepID=A0A7Z7LXF4_9FLAO|nr:lanthionine synthetase LanC family protein [Elizabethkingia anophelis]MCT3629395.1 hypothetical protein [Elizabethkingia anophelis]MCT3632758.1 hypothetical protein [Elizabethkingia anophelis]MCT3672839.1 hypothetical protein [Elizabethkingia anophelis]MCT3680673.1 hypothetical protein [Elizabethkingia anophelis]MCT3691762.1 hypothetical protein [Elizabethkingia anophelis]